MKVTNFGKIVGWMEAAFAPDRSSEPGWPGWTGSRQSRPLHCGALTGLRPGRCGIPGRCPGWDVAPRWGFFDHFPGFQIYGFAVLPERQKGRSRKAGKPQSRRAGKVLAGRSRTRRRRAGCLKDNHTPAQGNALVNRDMRDLWSPERAAQSVLLVPSRQPVDLLQRKADAQDIRGLPFIPVPVGGGDDGAVG